VVLFARTRHFCRLLQRQFLDGGVRKRYLAGVSGHPAADHFHCDAAISGEAEALGSRRIDEEAGLPARTDFKVLARRADGTSLLEADLSSGRTNQIRLHLMHLGHPVLGDAVYQTDACTGGAFTASASEPPLQLHAWKLTLVHPRTGEPVEFEAPAPPWAGGLQK
jgi:UPF0176 protein